MFVAEISTVGHGPATDEVTIRLAQPTLQPAQYQASRQLTIAGKLGNGVDVSKSGKPLDDLTEAYSEAADLWQIAGDSYQHGRAAMVRGWLAAWDFDTGSAEANYQLAIELLAQSNPRTPWAHIGLGAVQFQLDKSIAARRSFEEAVRLTKGRDLRANSAATNFLGLLEQSAGRPREAAKWYREVLAILEQSDYPSQEAVTLGNLGGTYFQMGQFQTALPYFLRALALHESAGDREEQATMLGNIASLYREQGSLQKSLTYNLQTLDVYRSLSNELGVALVQHRLGLLYQRMGDYRRAQRFLSQAYASRKAQGSLRRSASSLRALGALHNERGQTQKAQAALREAIDVYREIDNRSGLARSRAELAESLISEGQLREATEVLLEARPFFVEAGLKRDQAESALLMGQAVHERVPAEAAEWFQQAITLSQESEDPVGEVRARSAYSRVLEDPAQQRHELERAEEIASRVRQQIGNPALRARFAASMQFLYDSLVQWHIQQSPDAADLSPAALLASETWRGRSLTELVSASQASASEATAKLLRDRVALQEQLNALAFSTERLARAADNPAAQELASENRLQMAELRTRIDEVTAQVFDQVELPDPSASPEIAQIQKRLQDNEAILYFHLGSPRSVVWWISSDLLQADYLADRSTINQAAGAALAAVQAVDFGLPQREALKRLREMVLPNPKRVSAKRRVYLVLDGELQRVPFAALPDADGGFVLNHTSFVQLPAARVLLSERAARRMTSQSSALVFADPVFDPADPRAQSDASTFAGEAPASYRANLARLAFSSREATGISDVLPNAEMVLGYAASRAAFLERAKTPADILHLATHGIVDVESPTASGLYFSQVDAGRQWTDGFVGLGDIATIPMSFSLAVLSACDTGTGELIDGEGLFSLSRQFLAQGVDQVISTLWQVSDYSSAELMKETYRLMLVDGVPPDLALQQAQKALSARPGFDAPYFWAGYNLHTTRPLGQSPDLNL